MSMSCTVLHAPYFGRSLFEIKPGTIQVWDAFGSVDPHLFRDFYTILSEEEQIRAQRFCAEWHRVHFVTCRGWLRLLLSAYLGQSPEEVELVTGEYGKPRLKIHPPDRGLVFNISHAGERKVFAFGMDCMLGIDIEQSRRIARLDGMIDRICSEEERSYWRLLPVERQAEYFFSIWVRKEAIIKAQGQGLSLGMQHCELSADLGHALRLPNLCGSADNWSLQGLDYSDRYQGAIAVSVPFTKLERQALPEKLLLNLLQLTR